MTDLTPLPGTAEDSPVLSTQDAKEKARDIYIVGTGDGVRTVGSFIVSHRDGDVIQLKGGATGASFAGYLFWSVLKGVPIVPAVLQQGLDNNKRLSRQEAKAFAVLESASADTFLDAEKALKDIRDEQEKVDIQVIREIDNISLKEGETFTITNNEDFIADEFFTELKGRIQWGIGFEVIETQYNATIDFNDEFGKEIEDKTEFKGLATSLFKFIRAGRGGGPIDFVIDPEEEGGFQIEEETILGGIREVLGDFGENVKDVAAMAAIILGSILAIFLMITMRKPLQAAAGGLTTFVQESISR
jgi:hypothetical protein